MISRIQQPVLKASETQWLISGGAARWRFAARAIGMAAAFAVTAALTGCGASASHQADVQAQAATSRASILLAHAGMYHLKANFPITISAPLSPGQLIADKDAAKGNPGAYLQSPSESRDLRHAYATVSNALSNSELTFQYKGLLEMQRGLIGLAAAQVNIDQLSSALMALQNQVLSMDATAAQVGRVAGKMAFLKKQQNLYLHLYDQQLQHAQEMYQSAVAVVAEAQKKRQALAGTLAHYQKIAKALVVKGMALQAEGTVTVTPATLADFKRGAGFLNRAAAANQKVNILQVQYQFAQMAVKSAESQRVRWADQVSALRQAQKSAAELARSDRAQIAAHKAGVTVLVDGMAGHSLTSAAGRAATINKLLKTIDKQATAAQKLTDQAALDLTSALNEQRRSSAYAQSLIASGSKPGDPLVVANQNRAPECVLEVYRAAAALKSGQIAAMRMYGAQLQLGAARAGRQIFSVVSETSPLRPPAGAVIESFRKQAMMEFNMNATGALKQAQTLYSEGASSLQWIVPAMQYNIDLSVAGISDNSAVRAAALKAAEASAQQALKVNSALNLPLPKQ